MQNTDIKKVNKRNIVKLLYGEGDWSKRSIATHLNLSPSVVTRLCDELLKQNIITLTDTMEGPGAGRKATKIEINPSFKKIIGITINDQITNIVVCDMNFEMSIEKNIPTNTKPDEFVQTLGKTVRSILKSISITPDAILGIGISLKGKTDCKNAYYGVWNHSFALRDALKKEFKSPIVIDNGVRSSAIFEQLRYSQQNFLLVKYVKAGIGAAVVNHGQVRYGQTNNIADFGHMIIDPSKAFCPICRRPGCLESLISVENSINTLKAEFSIKKTPILWELCQHDSRKITPDKLSEAADLGSIPVNNLFRNNARLFAQGIINLEASFDIRKLIVIGNFFDSKRFTNYFKSALTDYQLTPLSFDIMIRNHKNNKLAPVALMIDRYFLTHLDKF